MNLFGIGPGELVVILLIAVLVFGPEKVPDAARKAGKWYAEFRRMTQDITSQVTRQLDDEIVKEEHAQATPSAGGASPAVVEGEAQPAALATTGAPGDNAAPPEAGA